MGSSLLADLVKALEKAVPIMIEHYIKKNMLKNALELSRAECGLYYSNKHVRMIELHGLSAQTVTRKRWTFAYDHANNPIFRMPRIYRKTYVRIEVTCNHRMRPVCSRWLPVSSGLRYYALSATLSLIRIKNQLP